MKTDFSRWIARPQKAQSYLLMGSDDEYLAFCAQMIVNCYRRRSPEMVVEKFSQDSILDDPSSLHNQPSLFAPVVDKIVLIDQCSDKIIKVFASTNKSVVLILMAAGSSVKKLKEHYDKSVSAVMMTCYLNNNNDKLFCADTLLAKHKLQVTEDAKAFFVSRIDTSVGLVDSEMAKCALYALNTPLMTLEDVQNCTIDYQLGTVFEIAEAVCNKSADQLLEALATVQADSLEEIPIVRIVSSSLLKIFFIQRSIDQGKTVDESLRMLRPPLPLKAQNAMKQQVRLWTVSMILTALNKLREHEASIKKGASCSAMPLTKLLLELTLMR